MQRRCCWPPERPDAGLVEPVLDLVPERRRARSDALDGLAQVGRAWPRCSRRPAATLSKIDIVGNGFGFWNTIPITRRTAVTSTPGA